VGHLLYFEIQPAAMKIARYFFVGAAAAAVDITLFGLLTMALGLPWFPVAIVSFVAATAVNYHLSIRHVFSRGVRFAKHQKAILIYAVSGIGLAVNQGMLWLLIDKLFWHLLLAKVIATGVVFFWNYGSRCLFIFRPIP
jgi:putative flippase GtrA